MYQGHLPDGSSVQKHSAGGAYPYVLIVRDAQLASGEKYDWGIIGPDIDGIVWCPSSAAWSRAVEQLLARRRAR